MRVLVATAVREAAAGAAPDVLLALSAARERTATAPPAPPNGLMLAGVGYGDHPAWDRPDARGEERHLHTARRERGECSESNP